MQLRDNLQRINSCTKSIVSTLIGIAIEEGCIPSVDMTLNNKMFFAMGRNGQFIIVIPSLQTVIVFTSMLDNTIKPLDFVREFIVKSMGNGF